MHYVQIAHTIHQTAHSFVGIYVPIFLLTQGLPLVQVIGFYIAFHGAGLLFTLAVSARLVDKWGAVRALKLCYPLEISFLVGLALLPTAPQLFWWLAVVGGVATFSYWVPMNMLLLRHGDGEKMGSDLAMFFAMPKVFSIVGPLVSALSIPFVGFWPILGLTTAGVFASYIPLRRIAQNDHEGSMNFRWKKLWQQLRERKFLFLLEGLDNILEEAEWFWAIFVYLLVGNISAPGIVGSLEALGAAAVTLLAGKFADKHARSLVPLASLALVAIWIGRFWVEGQISVYVVTLLASFVMTFFLISYFTFIYKRVKSREEKEFLVAREIPTALGRMVIFGAILLTLSDSRMFFVLPIVTATLLVAIFSLQRRGATA